MLHYRSSLAANVIRNNMYVRVNMSTLDTFNPLPALNRWFSLRDRHPRQDDKAKEQEWFAGVFHEADKHYTTRLPG